MATALLSAAWPAVVRGEDGRDFAGFYDVTDVVEAGGQVSLTLTVQVFNYDDELSPNIACSECRGTSAW
jgi:hypothetical protein